MDNFLLMNPDAAASWRLSDVYPETFRIQCIIEQLVFAMRLPDERARELLQMNLSGSADEDAVEQASRLWAAALDLVRDWASEQEPTEKQRVRIVRWLDALEDELTAAVVGLDRQNRGQL